LATAIAAWLNVTLLGVFLRRHDYWRPDRLLGVRVAKMAGATTVMAGCLLAARHALVPQLGQHVSVVVLGVLIGTGLVVYGVLAQGLGVFDAAGFVRKGLRRLRRGSRVT